jgi:hypothetical protein
MKIEGGATTMTRLAAYASCSRLAWTAPAAEIAAQVDTADASSAPSLTSAPNTPPPSREQEYRHKGPTLAEIT